MEVFTMAFINERVPKEQKKEFAIPNYRTITPSFWTIDKEKNIILFDYWTNIDKPNEEYFALVINSSIIKVKLWRETEHPNIVRWSGISVDIPSSCKLDKSTILEILREAMKTYGMSGFQFYDEGPIETIIEF